MNNHPHITVVLLTGLPGSGKSTVARNLQKRLPGLIHIEYDSFEDSILGLVPIDTTESENHQSDRICDENNERHLREAWNRARQNAVETMTAEIQKVQEQHTGTITRSPGTRDTTIILMDDNFHLRGMRKQIHRKLLEYRPMLRFGVLYLNPPLEICMERNRFRTGRRRIPEDIIVKMNRVFEPPKSAWEVDSTKIVLDGESEMNSIVEFIEKCPEIVELPPDPSAAFDPEKQAADRAATRKNEIHNLDQLLRSFVGKVAKFDKAYSRKANDARKQLLQQFKNGEKVFRTDDGSNGRIAEAYLDLVFPTETEHKTANTSSNDASAATRLEIQTILNG